MKKTTILLIVGALLIACNTKKENSISFQKYDESSVVKAQQKHENPRMQFKLIQSKYLDLNTVFKPFDNAIASFTEEKYNALKPLILEQDIPTLQQHVKDGKLTYEKLTLFYLYRIYQFEKDSTKSLQAIIALNPKVLEEARAKDKAKRSVSNHSLYGMPILLKDNINTKGMATTAGAAALQHNQTKEDAFIVQQLKKNGALILGKVNLSEWAYFFCSGCPLGYSAIGGQTLNPYGRAIFETGGSSSGSGVAVAANYAVAAVGTETSGSITSPSSQNSVVGLKPTIGVLSRTGIVPISSTLDTPGPMTKNVIDNAIFLEAMFGYDADDTSTEIIKSSEGIYADFDKKSSLQGQKIGVLKGLLTDSIYKVTIDKIKEAGAEIVELEPKQMNFKGFLTLLTADMKHDLPQYLKQNSGKEITIATVKDVTNFNVKDTLKRAPYGQALFDGIVKDTTSKADLARVKANLNAEGKQYLQALENNKVVAILSINNYHSGVAAVAKYPTLTVPMGYKKSGEPISLTFIGKPKSEKQLLVVGYAFEQLTKARKIPENYQ